MRHEERFKWAAWTYFVYGIIYLTGAVHLVSHGVGARGMTGAAAGLIWFVLGPLFIVIFPWLIWRGARGPAYLWFSRILTLLVAFWAFQVGRVALSPRIPSVPLPGGGEVSMAFGAWAFFVLTLVTMAVLSWAAWSKR